MRTLLRDSGLSHSYWPEAAAYSLYSIVRNLNLIPLRRHPASGRIPLESFTGKRQTVAHLRAFGSKCWAKITIEHKLPGSSKLDPRSVECHLLGASESGTGNYRDTSQGKVHDSDVATMAMGL